MALRERVTTVVPIHGVETRKSLYKANDQIHYIILQSHNPDLEYKNQCEYYVRQTPWVFDSLWHWQNPTSHLIRTSVWLLRLLWTFL